MQKSFSSRLIVGNSLQTLQTTNISYIACMCLNALVLRSLYVCSLYTSRCESLAWVFSSYSWFPVLTGMALITTFDPRTPRQDFSLLKPPSIVRHLLVASDCRPTPWSLSFSVCTSRPYDAAPVLLLPPCAIVWAALNIASCKLHVHGFLAAPPTVAVILSLLSSDKWRQKFSIVCSAEYIIIRERVSRAINYSKQKKIRKIVEPSAPLYTLLVCEVKK